MKTVDNKKTIRTSKNILRAILAVLICTLIFACSDDDAPAGVIDLSAEDMTFELIEDNGNSGGVAEIIGIVKNVGTRDYNSRPGAQSIQIRRKDAGFTSANVILMNKDFVSLGVGEELIIKTQINWSTATPEFKPEFIITIRYDPDNLIDGIPDNDDKNFDNNSLTKSTEELDELFMN